MNELPLSSRASTQLEALQQEKERPKGRVAWHRGTVYVTALDGNIYLPYRLRKKNRVFWRKLRFDAFDPLKRSPAHQDFIRQALRVATSTFGQKKTGPPESLPTTAAAIQKELTGYRSPMQHRNLNIERTEARNELIAKSLAEPEEEKSEPPRLALNRMNEFILMLSG